MSTLAEKGEESFQGLKLLRRHGVGGDRRPYNPTGGTFDMGPLPALLHCRPRARFLVDKAFIGMAGESVASWVPASRTCW
jgi:hypothetical protein